MQHKVNRSNNGKRKAVLVSSLSLLVGLTAIGSVTGTLAWYQYSTLASASYIFTTAKTSELLQVRVGEGDWKSSLTTTDFTTYLGGNYGTAIAPVTTGDTQARDAALVDLKSNPRYQVADPANWGDAAHSSYVAFPLSFRVLAGGASATDLFAQDVDLYLSDVTFRDVDNTGLDTALRVHFANTAGSKYMLVSENGGETTTSGVLDLNGDGKSDTSKRYEWEDDTEITYGKGTETSYAPSEVLATVQSDGTLSGGVSLGTIPASSTVTITVTIYLQGWQSLSNSVIWDMATYVGKSFGVGLSFSIPKLV